MTPRSLPPALFPPLTDNEELIAAIAAVSGEPFETVLQRLLDEERCGGINVKRDADRVGLRRYVWSDELIDFYRTTKSFLYETACWNRSPLKMQMREWIGRFIQKHELTGARVLTYGDGLGFDSAFLSMLGCHVTYFEPSEECSRFARGVFERNGLQIEQETSVSRLSPESFDIVLCLDVLEHVPNPPEVVSSFRGWLKEGGYLVTHSPFFYTEPYHPTHLASNRRFSGDERIFREQGLVAVDASFLWDPIVLQKVSEPRRSQLPFAARIGQRVLQLGRWTWIAHSAVARLVAGGDPRWATELQAIQGRRALDSQNGLDDAS